jgi:hypothetical protein
MSGVRTGSSGAHGCDRNSSRLTRWRDGPHDGPAARAPCTPPTVVIRLITEQGGDGVIHAIMFPQGRTHTERGFCTTVLHKATIRSPTPFF